MLESHRQEIAKLEALYASNPGGRVFVHLAEALRKGGEHERARSILDEGLARHPDSASAYVVLGRVLVDQGANAEAASAFRTVLDLDGGNLVALRCLGDLARSGGRLQEAMDRYRELVARNPASEDVTDIIRELEADLQQRTGPEGRDAEPGAADSSASGEGVREAVFPTETMEPAPEAAGEPVSATAEPAATVAPGQTGPSRPAEPEFGEVDLSALPGDLAAFAGLIPAATTAAVEAAEVEPQPLDDDAVMLIESSAAPLETEELEGAFPAAPAEVHLLGAMPDLELEREFTAESSSRPGEESGAAAAEREPATFDLDLGGLEQAEEVIEPAALDLSDMAVPPETVEAEIADLSELVPVADLLEPAPLSAADLEEAERDSVPVGVEASEEPAEGDVGQEYDRAADEGWLAAQTDQAAPVGYEETPAEPEPSWALGSPAAQQPATEPELEGLELPGDVVALPPLEAADVMMPEEAETTPVEAVVWEVEAFPSAADTFGGVESGAVAEQRTAPFLESDGEVVTETLADLYLAQGFADRAADMYRALLRERPDDGQLLAKLQRAEGSPDEELAPAEAVDDAGDVWLRGVEAAWTGGDGAVVGETTPYAWTEGEEREEGVGIAAYLRGLLSWGTGAPEPAAPRFVPVDQHPLPWQPADQAAADAGPAAEAKSSADADEAEPERDWTGAAATSGEVELEEPQPWAAEPDPWAEEPEPWAGETESWAAEPESWTTETEPTELAGAQDVAPDRPEPADPWALTAEPVFDETWSGSTPDETWASGAEPPQDPWLAPERDVFEAPAGPAPPTGNPVEDAFYEWFGPPEQQTPVAPSPAEPAPAAATPPADETAAASRDEAEEADEDLEMFRAWLKSLKR